jgi:hypothetical protein
MSTSPQTGALRANLQALAALVVDPLEGYRDYVRLAAAGEDPMRAAAQAKADALQALLDKIASLTAALDVLEADENYPAMTPLVVPQEVFEQFTVNNRTIDAALAQIEAERAIGASLTLSSGVEKPFPEGP